MIYQANINNFEEIYNIMEEAFPADERRPKQNQKQLFEKEEYCVYGYFTEDTLVGFAAVWKCDGFAFIEHLAVHKDFRGKGIGKQLTEYVKAKYDEIVLEVEPPLSEEQQQRIEFYLKNGFNLNGYYYIQPSLHQGQNEIELKLMSYPARYKQHRFDQVVESLYLQVYGIVER